jgi:hypothetical protein
MKKMGEATGEDLGEDVESALNEQAGTDKSTDDE